MPRVQVFQQIKQLPPGKIAIASAAILTATVGFIALPIFTYLACCALTLAAACYTQKRSITRLLSTTLSLALITASADAVLPLALTPFALLTALTGFVAFTYTGWKIVSLKK